MSYTDLQTVMNANIANKCCQHNSCDVARADIVLWTITGRESVSQTLIDFIEHTDHASCMQSGLSKRVSAVS